LSNHDSQLSRYFNATPAVRFAILTNGVEYKFYTDLNQNNMMDEKPFVSLNVSELSEMDIEVLNRFKRDNFDTDELIDYANELVYTANINKKLREIFRNPPDEFIRYLIKDFSDHQRITASVLEKFRPIVKKSISIALLDLVSQGLFKDDDLEQDNGEQEKEEVVDSDQDNKGGEQQKVSSKIVTTEEELQGFELIKDILKNNGINTSNIHYKDTIHYFSIFCNESKWFVRLILKSKNKTLVTKLNAEEILEYANGFEVDTSRFGNGCVKTNKVEDISKLNNLILECYKNATN